MPFERLFLGTGAHCLHAVRDVLVERCAANAGELDLSHLMLALPTGRAGRRLQELVLDHATENSLVYAPPTVVTLGVLSEYFLVPDHPRPTEIEEALAWLRVLNQASATDLDPLLGRGERTPESIEELAQRLARLTRELGGAGLTFADVAVHEAVEGSHEERRWLAMSHLHQQWEGLLDSVGFESRDTQLHRACNGAGTLDHGDITTVCFISADLNHQQRRLLDQLSESGMEVMSMVHADEGDSDAFDAHGCVIPDVWTSRLLPVDDDHLRIVNDVDEQVATAIELLGSLEPIESVDSVSVGIPDGDLIPSFRRVFPAWGVALHDPAGRPLPNTSIGRLLSALEIYLERGHAADLAGLLRHPFIEHWIDDQPGSDGIGTSGVIEAYDRLLEETVPLELATFLPARHKSLHEAIRPLLLQLQPMRHAVESVAERAESLRSLLEAWLTPLLESEMSDDTDLRAIDQVMDRLADFARADARITEPVSCAGMIRQLMSALESCTIRMPEDDNAVEALGWLECHLDDAPVLLLAGFNEGVVPSSINADAFLPNELRRRLGMLDNDRRYARDAFLLEAIIRSGRTTRIIVGRQGPDGDPLRPSRLLLTGDTDATVERILSFSTAPSTAPRSPDAVESENGFQTCPVPVSIPKIHTMSVTSFRDYLACPYRFMLGHVLRLRTRDHRPDEIDGGLFGTLAHLVLERYGTLERDGHVDSTDERIVRGELDRLLNELVEERFSSSRLPSVHMQLSTLRLRLRAYAAVHAEQARAGWRVRHVELSFGDDASGRTHDHPPAKLPGVPGIRLAGKIDRLDYNEELGLHRVIDYKTGDTGKGVIASHCTKDRERWFDLQMPLYRHLLRSIDVEIEPAGLCYVQLPAKIEDTKLDEPKWKDEDLELADEKAREVASNVLSGQFDPDSTFRASWDSWSRICGTGIIEFDGDDEEDDA